MNTGATEIRHATASAIVLSDDGRVLLVEHRKAGLWLYPGGHVDANEDPVQAAVREVYEETNLRVEIVTDPLFTHPAVQSHPVPFAIIEMPVRDATVGAHRHIDMVYVCRPLRPRQQLTAQLAEIGDARWVPVADVATFPTPAELPDLITAAAVWAKARW